MLPAVVLVFSLATLALHGLSLVAAGPDVSVSDPISRLSQGDAGVLHGVSLALFGSGQVLLAISLRGLERGRFWPYGGGCLAAAGIGVFFVAYYFAAAGPDALAGPDANDPLWVAASLAGLAMGLLQPGFSRLSPRLGRFNAFSLSVWLLLIPAILLVDLITPGVYERVVGTVYVMWVAGVAFGLMRIQQADGRQG